MNGRFENSAFCLLAPNGQDWLSKANRGPEMVLGRRESDSVKRMQTLAALYPPTADVKQAIVPDFHSVRQALNVASADQRVLVLMTGSLDQLNSLRDSMRQVATDDRIVGRFHFDFESENDWRKTVSGIKDGAGILLIRPGEFGMDGSVMKQLPVNSANTDVVDALLQANKEFAKTTARKVYSEHVSKGRGLGIYFEGTVPYGEDRDGDGEIDGRGRGGSRSRSNRSRTGRRPER